MHNAAFATLGLDWAYVPLPVAPEPAGRVAEAVRGLRALGFRGANVTVPHKQAVMAALDEVTAAARAMGAVNTIVVQEDGSLLGDNTDGAGFAADLQAHGVDVRGQQVLVLGAGGSARAVVYALGQAGAAGVTVANRSLARAQALVTELAPCAPDVPLCALALDEALDEALEQAGGRAALVVNTTSLGMAPAVEGLPWPEAAGFAPGQVVYDLVYAPAQTRLLRLAAAGGARPIGGLGMLVWQGALAFTRWTGLAAPIDVMRAAAEQAAPG
jgi:shikimate dehydrogenase